MMKSISPATGDGSRLTVEIGVSVVPTQTWPCHGMANMTRPGPVVRGGLGQVNQQRAGVELAVMIEHAPAQAILFEGWNALQHFLTGEQPRAPKPIFAGEQIVHFQADAVKGRFPPLVVRDDK